MPSSPLFDPFDYRIFSAFFPHIPSIYAVSSKNAVYDGFKFVILPYICSFMDKANMNVAIILGRRIRSLRAKKRWTQQELGHQADVNYKFIGEIERGQQNPSLNVLEKISNALGVELKQLFEYEQEIIDRREIEERIKHITKNVTDDEIRQILAMLRSLYPTL
jgi:transcriptional regulator with XRE-family HTH domain